MPSVYHYDTLSTASESIDLITSIIFVNDLYNFSRVAFKLLDFIFCSGLAQCNDHVPPWMLHVA